MPLVGSRTAAALLLLMCFVTGCAVPLSGMTPVSRSKNAIKIERGMSREQVHEVLRQSGYKDWQAQYDHDVVVADALWTYAYQTTLYLFAYHGPHYLGVHRAYYSGDFTVSYDAACRVTSWTFDRGISAD